MASDTHAKDASRPVSQKIWPHTFSFATIASKLSKGLGPTKQQEQLRTNMPRCAKRSGAWPGMTRAPIWLNQHQAYQVRFVGTGKALEDSASSNLAKSAQHNHQQEHLRYSESIRKNVHNPITSLNIIHSFIHWRNSTIYIYICTYIFKIYIYIHIFHWYKKQNSISMSFFHSSRDFTSEVITLRWTWQTSGRFDQSPGRLEGTKRENPRFFPVIFRWNIYIDIKSGLTAFGLRTSNFFSEILRNPSWNYQLRLVCVECGNDWLDWLDCWTWPLHKTMLPVLIFGPSRVQ